MEGLSNSSERARKLFERVVDIVTNDIVHERPNSLPVMHTPQRSDCDPDPCTSRMASGDRRRTTSLQAGVHCGSGGSGISAAPENKRLLTNSSATPEYNRLFGFQNKRKDCRKDPKKCKGRSVSTWVHDCICLAVHHQDWLPTPHDKMELASWGLGLKRLSFARDASPAEIETVVCGSFPRLSGRYELLRTGPKSKGLVVISTPPGGMTIPYIMDIVQQSKLYIRPKDQSLVVRGEDMI
jgi:hypothetical protein